MAASRIQRTTVFVKAHPSLVARKNIAAWLITGLYRVIETAQNSNAYRTNFVLKLDGVEFLRTQVGPNAAGMQE